MVPVALLVVFVLFIAVVVRSIRQQRALKDFDGPWSAGWSRLWLLRTQSSGEMNKRFTQLNRKYGKHNFYIGGRGVFPGISQICLISI